ncbi:MAG: N-acetyltransferase [Phycisphaerales bacterium]|nr:MAG: N-acetyltransferase [Phycisphaerales bacterium]
MNIRLATIDDVPAILALSNHHVLHSAANFAIEPESLEAWREDFNETHEMYPWFVAAPEDGGDESILGFAKASPWKGRCAYAYSAEITVYVHPDHHRKGIGRALYAKLLETMKAQGYQTVLGGIALPNDASVALHESFGLTCSGVLKRVGWKFGKWHDVGYWQGVLNEGDAAPAAIRPVSEVTG